jgi:hypothetical protein
MILIPKRTKRICYSSFEVRFWYEFECISKIQLVATERKLILFGGSMLMIAMYD